MLLIIFHVFIILKEALLPCNSRKVRGGDIAHYEFYRLSDLGCPDFVGTIGLDAAYHHVFIVPIILYQFQKDPSCLII